MYSREGWNTKRIPSLKQKTVIVTGGSGGLGIEICLELARAGCKVILASRNKTNGNKCVDKIKSIVSTADVEFQRLNLASLKSIASFCEEFNSRNIALDILVNNAGVMPLSMLFKTSKTTVDGHNPAFGINYLGHYALTAQLIPSLQRSISPRGRVITVSSIMHHYGKIKLYDLQSQSSLFPFLDTPYCNANLANLMFAFELQRRSMEGHWGIVSIAAHAGFSRTKIATNGISSSSGESYLLAWMINNVLMPLFSQKAPKGALPILYAAVCSEARPGGYYGPSGLFELKGVPYIASVKPAARNVANAKRLWRVSEKLTGVKWPSNYSV